MDNCLHGVTKVWRGDGSGKTERVA